MSSDANRQDLQRAYDYIKAGKKQEAADLLMPILKADEQNANAWWLLANAVTEPADIREALQQVLKLRPGDAKAQKMLDDLNRRSPTDEFPMDDVGSMRIGDMMGDVPKHGGDMGDVIVTKPKGGGTNPLLIVLAVVGVLALLACIVCVGLPLVGVSLFGGQMVNQFMTAVPDFQELAQTITALPVGGFSTSGDLVSRGTIEPGQTVHGTVDTFDDDGWTFQGSSGDRVIIELNSTDNDLDPQLYLFDAQNHLVGENDDIDAAHSNMNSKIEMTLPSSGTFTIRVSAFGSGGTYDLSLRRG